MVNEENGSSSNQAETDPKPSTSKRGQEGEENGSETDPKPSTSKRGQEEDEEDCSIIEEGSSQKDTKSNKAQYNQTYQEKQKCYVSKLEEDLSSANQLLDEKDNQISTMAADMIALQHDRDEVLARIEAYHTIFNMLEGIIQEVFIIVLMFIIIVYLLWISDK